MHQLCCMCPRTRSLAACFLLSCQLDFQEQEKEEDREKEMGEMGEMVGGGFVQEE
jgi:hypothetical protein